MNKSLLAAALAGALGAFAQAQTTLYWDANGTGLGGTGTFTGTSTTFNTAADGSGTQTADSSASNTLVFQGSGGTVTLSGSTITAQSFTFNTATSAYTWTSGSVIGSFVFAGSNNVTISSFLNFGAGAGSTLLQSGTGTTTLVSGKVAFTGGVTVSAGTLIATAVGASAVTVDGGTFESSGTVDNFTMSSGAVSPSAAGTGVLKIASGDQFTMSGGTLNLSLGTTSGSIFGNSSTSFSVTGGTLALTLGTGFSYPNHYTIFNGFSGSNTVSNLTITGYDTTHELATLSNAGVLSFSAIAVPEPSTYALIMGSAALAAAFWRRRAVAA